MTTHVTITRRATFAAAHILCRDDWDDEKNREVFGACVTDHGHNYVIEVTVSGPLDPETGMVVNLKHVDCPTRSGSARTTPAPISCWLVFVRPFGSHGRNQTLRKPADARCTSADGAVAVPGSARTRRLVLARVGDVNGPGRPSRSRAVRRRGLP